MLKEEVVENSRCLLCAFLESEVCQVPLLTPHTAGLRETRQTAHKVARQVTPQLVITTRKAFLPKMKVLVHDLLELGCGAIRNA